MANSWWLMRSSWQEKRAIDEWWAKKVASRTEPIVWAPKGRKKKRKKKAEDK